MKANVIVPEEKMIVREFVVVQLVMMSVVSVKELVCQKELVTVKDIHMIVIMFVEVLLILMNVEFVTVQVFFLTYAIALAKKWTVKVNAVVKLEKMSVVNVKVMVSQKDFVIVKVVQLIAMVFVVEEW